MHQILRRSQRSTTSGSAQACWQRDRRTIITDESHGVSIHANKPARIAANAAVNPTKLGRLVLVRHGESIWNITDHTRGISPRFSGWADIPLTPLGVEQAIEAGKCLHVNGYKFDTILTSVLSRSMKTLHLLIREMPDQSQDATVIHSWRLNERHYGSLVGQSKKSAALIASKYNVSVEDVWVWRRSWRGSPPPMSAEHAQERRTELLYVPDGDREAACDMGVGMDGQYDDYDPEVTRYPGYIHRATVVTRVPQPLPAQHSTASAASTTASTHIPFYLHPQAYSSTVSEEAEATPPLSESLEDTAVRVFPLWQSHVLPTIGRFMCALI